MNFSAHPRILSFVESFEYWTILSILREDIILAFYQIKISKYLWSDNYFGDVYLL